MAKTDRAFGWRPEPPDVRDYHYVPRMVRAAAVELPQRVDLREKCPPIRDQGNLGACTGFAITAACAFIHGADKFADHALSPLFVYYNERRMEGSIKYDAGAYIRDGIKSIRSEGACHELRWPYRIERYRWKPRQAAYTDALKNLIGSYSRITTLEGMRSCLAEGFPFVFGFTVYPEFVSAQVARDGNVPMPSGRDAPIGGHAVLAVGYDDAEERFICRNSWGTLWGERGYFRMPYAYVGNYDLADDFWTVRAT